MEEHEHDHEQEIEFYRKGVRWAHWVISFAALTLAITGLFLYVPQLGFMAQDGYTRIIHRIAAVVFVGVPVLYFVFCWRDALEITRSTFTIEKDIIKWIKAAPEYYFGGSEENMPPQGTMNPGQKIWAIAALFGSIAFVITGLIMWAFKGSVSSEVFLWCVFLHDVCFILLGSFLLVHFYLGVLHPRMTESMHAMITGKITIGYAEDHHGKWLRKREILSKKAEKETTSAGAAEQE